jgi:hypothetical protein
MDKTALACPNCGREVQGPDAFCHHCGRPVPSAPAAAKPGSPAENENYLALVRADVRRLRRQWHLAEVECSEVLRRDPDNPDAYSVMGDIYRDQGQLRDAIEWYRMALDRNPASVADRRKLEALIDRVFPRRQQEKIGGLASSLRRKLSPEGPSAPAHPSSMTATIALALAVVFAIAVSTALLSHQAPSPTQALTPSAASGAFTPTSEDPGAAHGSAGAGQKAKARVDDEMAEALPSLESGLLTHLQTRAASVDVTCQVTSVEIDPVASSASVRFTMPRLWSPAEGRQNIARVASALAAETFAFDTRINSVKARCHLRGVGEEGQVAMLAETDRDTAAAAQEAGAGGEETFTLLWWHPDLRRGPDSQPTTPEG